MTDNTGKLNRNALVKQFIDEGWDRITDEQWTQLLCHDWDTFDCNKIVPPSRRGITLNPKTLADMHEGIRATVEYLQHDGRNDDEIVHIMDMAIRDKLKARNFTDEWIEAMWSMRQLLTYRGAST